MSLFDVLPFFLMNLDAEYEEVMWRDWPPMPAPVRWGLVNLAGSVHWGWWKFTSCGSDGRRGELYALVETELGDGVLLGRATVSDSVHLASQIVM